MQNLISFHRIEICKFITPFKILKNNKTKNHTNLIVCKMSSGNVVQAPRSVAKTILARAASEGGGDAVVRRSIGGFELKRFDPFLLLDDGSSETGNAGFPDHPHRGFETVSYVLQGAWKHEDFGGHKGNLEAGDLQWMTAGRGIVHSEIGDPSKGKSRGLQLWVNLSSQNKMIEPRYQELKSRDIPEAEKDGVKVRVIAGEAFGIKSQIYTMTPTMYLDFTMAPGSHLEQPIPPSWNAFVYVIEGEGVFANETSSPAKPYTLLLLGSGGDCLLAWNKSSNVTKFVLVAGQPLNEPVVQHGPFVMNTEEEIEKTFSDYFSYTNGFEKARSWKSENARGFVH
ncbi:transcription cofactor [Lithospermum erythrorhizon]|uniref:Transcription cofactor n=1 Tax=Lithospermum erythrorhizon TaxID=34254 RepID=A0AAV3P5C8_LITER